MGNVIDKIRSEIKKVVRLCEENNILPDFHFTSPPLCVLNYPEYDKLCENARKKVLENFDSKIVAQKYIQLYEEILGHTGSRA